MMNAGFAYKSSEIIFILHGWKIPSRLRLFGRLKCRPAGRLYKLLSYRVESSSSADTFCYEAGTLCPDAGVIGYGGGAFCRVAGTICCDSGTLCADAGAICHIDGTNR
jgi:hypothetical protein